MTNFCTISITSSTTMLMWRTVPSIFECPDFLLLDDLALHPMAVRLKSG